MDTTITIRGGIRRTIAEGLCPVEEVEAAVRQLVAEVIPGAVVENITFLARTQTGMVFYPLFETQNLRPREIIEAPFAAVILLPKKE